MAKILFGHLLLIIVFSSFAQRDAFERVASIEVGLTPFDQEALFFGNNTGISFVRYDGKTIASLGFEGGIFVSNNLAAKVGFGYTSYDKVELLAYKVGMKYYAMEVIPVQIDVTGAAYKDHTIDLNQPDGDEPHPLWLAFQAGYAALISDQISFEPTIRSSVSLNRDFTRKSVLELRFNFVIFL